MYIKLLAKLLLGYVKVEIEGYYIERFINICTNNKILIWNLKRENDVKVYLNIGINDFKKITKVGKKTNCKIKILKKKGIPFILHKYKKRKIFGIFLILVLISIFVSSEYVWDIKISVKDNLEIENIEQDIETLGIKKGVKKDKIDTNKIINELRIKRDEIAWVGIDVEGTSVKINIVKSKKIPDIVNNSDYCNIIASKSGTIKKITAQNGTAVVNVGDSVQKGDILIAGYMEGKYTEPRLVHSLGKVEAIISYQKAKNINFKQEEYKYTGKEEKKYEIDLCNYKIKLYKNKSKYERYTEEKEEKNLKLSKNLYLPISIVKITNKEQTKEEKTYGLDEAVKIATDEATQEIEEKIENKNDIEDKRVDVNKNETGVTVTVTYDILEDIGENQKIE